MTDKLPTIKDIELHDKISIFDYAERINKVLSAHEEHFRKVIQEWVKFRAEALKKYCEEDVMMASEKVMYNLIRLEAIQSLRGTK